MQAHSQDFQKRGDKIGYLLLKSGGITPLEKFSTGNYSITCESIILTVKPLHMHLYNWLCIIKQQSDKRNY